MDREVCDRCCNGIDLAVDGPVVRNDGKVTHRIERCYELGEIAQARLGWTKELRLRNSIGQFRGTGQIRERDPTSAPGTS